MALRYKPVTIGWEKSQKHASFVTQDTRADRVAGSRSLIELLQGKLSAGVMDVVTLRDGGLLSKPSEISMACSCPDSADLCKHLAAVFYGIGGRLDHQPELLFLLRGVNPDELISRAAAAEAIRTTTKEAGKSTLSDSELADVFGIEISADAAPVVPATVPRAKKVSVAIKSKRPSTKPAKPKGQPASKLKVAAVKLVRKVCR